MWEVGVQFKNKEMRKRIKAYALVENGKLCHYYALPFIVMTKSQAVIEREYYNKNLGHKMTIQKCIILVDTKPKKHVNK